MKIKFEPRDLWVGIYWDRCGRITTLETDKQRYNIYICLIPCFPIIFSLWMNIPKSKRGDNW